VVFLRSPHAHAKIVGIDATEARRLPGVIAVVFGDPIPIQRFSYDTRDELVAAQRVGVEAALREAEALLV